MARRALTSRTGDEIRTLARCLDLCGAASDRAMGLLRSLEARGQTEDREGGVCDPRLVVGHVVEHLGSRLAEAGVAVELDLTPVPSLAMPASLLRRLATHLLVNAIEAMPAGGQIDVVLVGTVDGGVALVVQDTGAGVPSELRHRVFEPFFTTRHDAGAAGLGLAVSRAVAEEHGGRLRLDREYRDGARFVVEFGGQAAGAAS